MSYKRLVLLMIGVYLVGSLVFAIVHSLDSMQQFMADVHLSAEMAIEDMVLVHTENGIEYYLDEKTQVVFRWEKDFRSGSRLDHAAG